MMSCKPCFLPVNAIIMNPARSIMPDMTFAQYRLVALPKEILFPSVSVTMMSIAVLPGVPCLEERSVNE